MNASELSTSKNRRMSKAIINMNRRTTQTMRELREYARFLGIQGIWGKRKVDLENHIIDTINNGVEKRLQRKPNISYERAHMEAEVALRSKKLTRQKTWRNLLREVPEGFRRRRRTTKEDVERSITKNKRGELARKYRKNIIKRETLQSIVGEPSKRVGNCFGWCISITSN